MFEDPPCLVTCFVEGRELTSEELRGQDMLAEVARGLRTFHDSGLELPTEFQVYDVVRDYAEVARSRGGQLPVQFDAALERAGEIVEAVASHPDHRTSPNHNDLLAANFLRSPDGVVIVDWEYAGMGDPFFDLGNFAVNNELGDEDAARLLEAYFGEPATPRRAAALNLFCYMSDFREAMWGVVQTSVSELDFDFPGYADKHFTRLTAIGEDPDFRTRLERGTSRLAASSRAPPVA